jgi:hypothetical protein
MLHHFWNLICQSLAYMPTIISGNWVSIFFPFGIFLAGEAVRFVSGGRAAMSWKTLRLDSLLLFAAYALLFSWAVIRTVYDDHQTLVKANAKENRDVPGLDNARLEVTRIGRWNITDTKPPTPALRLFVHNQGGSAAIGFGHRDVLLSRDHELTTQETVKLMRLTRNMPQDQMSNLLTDKSQRYPNSPEFFFDMPLPSRIMQDFDRHMYVYAVDVIFFRDSTMSSDRIGVSEMCAYYINSFELMHNCGDLTEIVKQRDLISDDKDTDAKLSEYTQ